MGLQSGSIFSSRPEVQEKMKTRGQEWLALRKERMSALKDIAKTHWVGDEWIREADVLSSTPKHDPKREIVSGASLCNDGSAEIFTVVDADTAHAEMRLYHLELHDNVWKIRKYELFLESDEQ